LSNHTRLVRQWANETEPLRLINDGAAPSSLRPVSQNQSDRNAERMLEAAYQQVEQIRSHAEAEIEAQRDQIRAEAREQARQELQSEFEALIDASFERFNKIVAQARADQQRIARAAERDLIEIAIAIAQDVTGERPSAEAIEWRVRQGLELLSSSEVTTILLHPDDLSLVSPWIEEWEKAEGVQVEIAPDRAVEPGGCEIVARSAIYDFSPQARLQMIADAFREQGGGS